MGGLLSSSDWVNSPPFYEMENKYLIKAKKLIKANFCMVGYGFFDITREELALILEYIEKDDFTSIKNLYKKLEKLRL